MINYKDKDQASRSLLPKHAQRQVRNHPPTFSCKKLQVLVGNCSEKLTLPERISIELSAYIDKELPTWKGILIRQHLKRCPSCASHVLRLEETDLFLRHVELVKASNGFVAGVIAKAQAMNVQQQSCLSWWPLRKSPERQDFDLHTHSDTERYKKHKNPRLLEPLFGWIRQNIQTHSPIYTFVLTFAVFSMVGVTLYAPRGNQSADFSQHTLKKTYPLSSEKLISFEVIRHEEPKRSFKKFE